jgi:cytidylate kinase
MKVAMIAEWRELSMIAKIFCKAPRPVSSAFHLRVRYGNCMVLWALGVFSEVFLGRIQPQNAVRIHSAQLDTLLRTRPPGLTKGGQAQMAIITISRGSYSHGKEVAEKVAQRLGYQCIAREVILGASKEYNIPEIKLVKAVHDAPSVLEKFSFGKEKFIAYFQASLLKYLQRDNVVYNGLAGHFYVKGVSHVLKVRIIAEMKDRIQIIMDRETISYENALDRLKKDDLARRKWSQNLYGIDTADPILYDLVIRVQKMTVDYAVDVICHTAGLETFKTTFESQKAMEDLVLASEIKTTLLEFSPEIQVFVHDGVVTLAASAQIMKDPYLVREMERIAARIPGVKDINIKAVHQVEWSE